MAKEGDVKREGEGRRGRQEVGRRRQEEAQGEKKEDQKKKEMDNTAPLRFRAGKVARSAQFLHPWASRVAHYSISTVLGGLRLTHYNTFAVLGEQGRTQ